MQSDGAGKVHRFFASLRMTGALSNISRNSKWNSYSESVRCIFVRRVSRHRRPIEEGS